MTGVTTRCPLSPGGPEVSAAPTRGPWQWLSADHRHRLPCSLRRRERRRRGRPDDGSWDSLKLAEPHGIKLAGAAVRTHTHHSVPAHGTSPSSSANLSPRPPSPREGRSRLRRPAAPSITSPSTVPRSRHALIPGRAASTTPRAQCLVLFHQVIAPGQSLSSLQAARTWVVRAATGAQPGRTARTLYIQHYNFRKPHKHLMPNRV